MKSYINIDSSFVYVLCQVNGSIRTQSSVKHSWFK